MGATLLFSKIDCLEVMHMELFVYVAIGEDFCDEGKSGAFDPHEGIIEKFGLLEGFGL